MKTIRAVLVDDEFYALEYLRIQLLEIGDVEIVGMFEDVDDFLREVGSLHPDVVFLDVEMPKQDGFSVLDRIFETGFSPEIIFVTAYSHYAVKAFEIDATDYLVKPVDTERLRQSINRLRVAIQEPKTSQPLKISCYRTFRVSCGDVDLGAGWKRNKAEELLAYLICEKGRFVSKEKIAEDLWPETEGDKTQSNLHVAYYFLKQQEKNKGISLAVESQRGRMRICLDDAWCDLLQFDQLRQKAMDNAETPADRLMFLERAEELYDGDLLADKFYSWVVPLQQKYRIQYEEILQILIERHQAMGNERKARFYQERLDRMDA